MELFYTNQKIPGLNYLLQDKKINLNLIAAIDFTYSNGHPDTPSSHHYLHKGGVNHYQKALMNILKAIERYDTDKKIPVIGFGGIPRFMNQTQVSHCFPLNGNVNDYSINGMEELLEVYKQNVPKIEMSGPTKFAKLLKNVKEMVMSDQTDRENRDLSRQFHILMILTDGEVHDIDETIQEIKDIVYNNLPIYIAIVGIGEDNFSNMIMLDGDYVKIAVKDIVHFVRYNSIVSGAKKGKDDQETEKIIDVNLIHNILEEFPRIFMSHYANDF